MRRMTSREPKGHRARDRRVDGATDRQTVRRTGGRTHTRGCVRRSPFDGRSRHFHTRTHTHTQSSGARLCASLRPVGRSHCNPYHAQVFNGLGLIVEKKTEVPLFHSATIPSLLLSLSSSSSSSSLSLRCWYRYAETRARSRGHS
jgi:hypothetical protein